MFPFYNTFIEKPGIKKISSVQLLKELPFYDQLSIVKNKTYKIQIIDKIYPISQLKASELSSIDLFKELLSEIRGFKYQITLNILLSKVKSSDSI